MPGSDQTGPKGSGPMSGRGFGKCRTAPEPEPVAAEQPASQGSVQNIPVYVRGRGEIPCGYGWGFGIGGGRRLQR